MFAADREKQFVALTSVSAAVVLACAKLGVGLATNSLGVLSEAVHSGLDLVASLATWFAIRLASRPADSTHAYGHGKFENISAMFQTLLLLGTCIWIIVESVSRLIWRQVEVAPSTWAFAVMVLSIIVDVILFRMLSRVSRKYSSPSMEANALHFASDIWSSIVVFVGLISMELGYRFGVPWLQYADPAAALSVSIVSIFVSFRLGRKTIADLLDEVPPGLSEKIVSALQLPEVVRIGRIRVRRGGSDIFVEAELYVVTDVTFGKSHDIIEVAKQEVWRVLPGADVTIRVEPAH